MSQGGFHAVVRTVPRRTGDFECEKDAERIRVIDGAIEEIRGRRDLSPEAKERGIRALERARARLIPPR